MATTYNAKGKVFLTKSQFDTRKAAGTLQTGVEYMVTDSDNTPYVTEDYLQNALSAKQDSLSANSPLYIDSSNNICINYGHGLNILSEGCNQDVLGVDWSNMPVDSSTFYVDSRNNCLRIQSYNNLLNIGLYDYDNGAHIYMSSNNLDIYSPNGLYMAASSNVLLDASNYIRLQASNSILFLGDKSSYGGCNFPLDSGLWLKDTCGIGMLGNFGGISVLDKKVGIEVDSSNNTNIILTHNESPLRQIKITDDGVYVNAENSLIEATSSHILLQYGSSSNTAIEINADGVYIGGAKYGA